MTESNENLCKVCKINKCIEFSDPKAKYDICMMCYFIGVNSKESTAPKTKTPFELVES